MFFLRTVTYKIVYRVNAMAWEEGEELWSHIFANISITKISYWGIDGIYIPTFIMFLCMVIYKTVHRMNVMNWEEHKLLLLEYN